MDSKASVLIVDDEPLKILGLKKQLEAAGFRTVAHQDPKEALVTLGRDRFDVLVTDLRMPGMDGMELLEKARARCPGLNVILMTAYGSIENAVETMKRGAVDYLTKPFAARELILRIESLLSAAPIKPEAARDAQAPPAPPVIGEHSSIREVLSLAEKVAARDTTVLIQGESGTGKGLLAEYIHLLSRRQRNPFIKVSCASLSKDIFESELFGHEKGAFTGAASTRKGRFELAEGGTLFLDEVDDIPLDLQVKLLRFLQERKFERVGGEVTLSGDVRVICASKENLVELVEAGRFRQDLYYRLNIVRFTLPPLRDRVGDIPLIARFFLDRLAGGKNLSFADATMELLIRYPWPGNIRELENCVERASILKSDGPIEPGDLPAEIQEFSALGPPAEDSGKSGPINLRTAVRDTEKGLIEWALQVSGGNQVKAASLLRIPRTTLRDKMLRFKTSDTPPEQGP